MGKKNKSSKRSEALSTNGAKNMKDVKNNQIEDNEFSVPIKEEPKPNDIHEINYEVNKPDSNVNKDSLNKQSFDVKNEAQNENIEKSVPQITQKVNEIDHPKCSKSRRSRRRHNKYLSNQQKNDNLDANNEGLCDIMDTSILPAIQKTEEVNSNEITNPKRSKIAFNFNNVKHHNKDSCSSSNRIHNEEVTTSCSSNKEINLKKNNPKDEEIKNQICNKMKSGKGNKECNSSKFSMKINNEEVTSSSYSSNKGIKPTENNPTDQQIKEHNKKRKSGKGNKECNSSEFPKKINNEEVTSSSYSSNKGIKPTENSPTDQQIKEHNKKIDSEKRNKKCNSSEFPKKGNDKTSKKSEPKNDKLTRKSSLESYKRQIHTGNKDFPKDKILTENNKSFIKEIDENLFDLDIEFALAHCVAEDLRMGAGIAVDFKHKFGGLGNLIDQNLRIGDVGVLQRRGRYIFYLITKSRSYGKPTIGTMKQALLTLLNCMKELKLTKLGIPLIGCGLDDLDWGAVKESIIEIFNNSGIQITVCIPSKLDHKTPYFPIKVYNTPKNLWEIDPETYIIIFIDLIQVQRSDWKNKVIDNVNSRYPFKNNLLRDIASKTLKPGDITHYIFNQDIILCGFFHPDLYYSSLESIFRNVIHLDLHYKYLAIQSGPLSSNNNFQHIIWIVLILRSFAFKCELWLCGQEEPIENDFDQYCRNKRSSTNFISPNQ